MSAATRAVSHERMRVRAAAFRATRLYPGPVGDAISEELLSWEQFGWRLGSHGRVMTLVDHLIKTPLTKTAAA